MSELHLGKLVNDVRERQGMTEAEMARRIDNSSNNVNKFKKRKHFYTDVLDKLSIVLKHNFYLDKAKEIAATLDPTGVSEPVVPYELENWKIKYQECERNADPLHDKVRLLEMRIIDKENIIAQQEQVIDLLKKGTITNTTKN